MKNLLAPLQVWWSNASQREQRLLMIGGVALILGSLYWGVLQPMSERAQAAQMRIQSEKQLLDWVKNKANDITTLREVNGGTEYSNQPLNQLISASANRYSVELIRVQPRDESVQVWVSPMPFNQLIEWLDYLKNTQGVSAEYLDINRTDNNGEVEVNRLQFKRG